MGHVCKSSFALSLAQTGKISIASSCVGERLDLIVGSQDRFNLHSPSAMIAPRSQQHHRAMSSLSGMLSWHPVLFLKGSCVERFAISQRRGILYILGRLARCHVKVLMRARQPAQPASQATQTASPAGQPGRASQPRHPDSQATQTASPAG